MSSFTSEYGPTRPDTMLKVFDLVFRVHSFVLRAKSGFFEAFLDPKDAPFVYDTKIDEDGTWGLQPWVSIETKNDQVLPIEVADGDRDTFHFLLKVFYDQKPTLESIDHLQDVIRLADYYAALPALRTFVESNITNEPGIFVRLSDTCFDVLGMAAKLQSTVLFKEAFIHAVGQYSNGLSDASLESLDPKANLLIRHHCLQLKEVILQSLCGLLPLLVQAHGETRDIVRSLLGIQLGVIWSDQDWDEEAEFSGFLQEGCPQQISWEVISQIDRVCAFAESEIIHEDEIPDDLVSYGLVSAYRAGRKIKRYLHPIMQNRLTLPTEGEERPDYFLCANLPDAELPWNTQK